MQANMPKLAKVREKLDQLPLLENAVAKANEQEKKAYSLFTPATGRDVPLLLKAQKAMLGETPAFAISSHSSGQLAGHLLPILAKAIEISSVQNKGSFMYGVTGAHFGTGGKPLSDVVRQGLVNIDVLEGLKAPQIPQSPTLFGVVNTYYESSKIAAAAAAVDSVSKALTQANVCEAALARFLTATETKTTDSTGVIIITYAGTYRTEALAAANAAAAAASEAAAAANAAATTLAAAASSSTAAAASSSTAAAPAGASDDDKLIAVKALAAAARAYTIYAGMLALSGGNAAAARDAAAQAATVASAIVIAEASPQKAQAQVFVDQAASDLAVADEVDKKVAPTVAAAVPTTSAAVPTASASAPVVDTAEVAKLMAPYLDSCLKKAQARELARLAVEMNKVDADAKAISASDTAAAAAAAAAAKDAINTSLADGNVLIAMNASIERKRKESELADIKIDLKGVDKEAIRAELNQAGVNKDNTLSVAEIMQELDAINKPVMDNPKGNKATITFSEKADKDGRQYIEVTRSGKGGNPKKDGEALLKAAQKLAGMYPGTEVQPIVNAKGELEKIVILLPKNIDKHQAAAVFAEILQDSFKKVKINNDPGKLPKWVTAADLSTEVSSLDQAAKKQMLEKTAKLLAQVEQSIATTQRYLDKAKDKAKSNPSLEVTAFTKQIADLTKLQRLLTARQEELDTTGTAAARSSSPGTDADTPSRSLSR